jgi:hypothetical protein
MRRNALLGSFLLLITAFGTSVLYAWDEQPIAGPYSQVVALRSGDLDGDGDGDMDVIAETYDYFTAGWVWYENTTVGNPGATWVKHTVYASNADAPGGRLAVCHQRG